MYGFPLVSTSKGILAVGGERFDGTNFRYKDEIIQLKCREGKEVSDCNWVKFPQKLEIARDDLTIQLRKLEQNLQEKDLKVEVICSLL